MCYVYSILLNTPLIFYVISMHQHKHYLLASSSSYVAHDCSVQQQSCIALDLHCIACQARLCVSLR